MRERERYQADRDRWGYGLEIQPMKNNAQNNIIMNRSVIQGYLHYLHPRPFLPRIAERRLSNDSYSSLGEKILISLHYQ